MSSNRRLLAGATARPVALVRTNSAKPRLASARRLATLALAGLLAVAPLSGCSALAGANSSAETDSQESESAARTPGDIDLTSLFSDRDQDPSYDESEAITATLDDDGTTASGKGVEVDGSTVTITKAGTYVISGSLTDGQLVVDAGGEKVQLVLSGASISTSSSTALYVRNADKVFLTLADGTTNTISASGEDLETDDHNLDGAVWSHDDLTVNGSGTLVVSSACGHGIVSKDDLTLVSGAVSVTAAVDALQAKGDLAVGGGTWTLSAGDDGMHSDSDLVIVDGTVDVTQSYEGLEGATVTVAGGTANVISSDDGINASGVSDDSDESSTDEQDGAAAPQGDANAGAMTDDASSSQQGPGNGEQPPAQTGDASGAGEAPEPPSGAQNGGGTDATDGSTADGTDSQAQGTGEPPAQTGEAQEPSDMGAGQAPSDMGGGMDEDDETAYVYICGGSLTINAEGDGIDSNGDLLISAGEVYVEGSTGDGDGALDYAGTGQVSGGTIIALGSTGMVQSLEPTGDQGIMLVTLSGEAGGKVTLSDASGTELASYTATKSYACAVVSCEGIAQGEAYTLSNGSQSVEVTMDSTSYSDVTGGMGQGGPGQSGQDGQGGPGQDGQGGPSAPSADSADSGSSDNGQSQEATSA